MSEQASKKQRTDDGDTSSSPPPPPPPDVEEDMSNEWTAMAETYAAQLVPAFGSVYSLILKTVSQLSITPTALLDYGTGPGQPAKTLSSALPNTKVLGVDSSAGMIALAKRAASSAESDNLTFARLLANETTSLSAVVAKAFPESPERKFDVIVTSFTICYMDHADRVAWLKSLESVLAPNAKVVVVNWDRPSQVNWLQTVKALLRWKMSPSQSPITSTVIPGDEDDDEEAMLASGSFSLAREMTTAKYVSEAGWKFDSWKLEQVPISFATPSHLYAFVENSPVLNKDDDLPHMMAFVKAQHDARVARGDAGILSKDSVSLDDPLVFPTNVSVAVMSLEQ